MGFTDLKGFLRSIPNGQGGNVILLFERVAKSAGVSICRMHSLLDLLQVPRSDYGRRTHGPRM